MGLTRYQKSSDVIDYTPGAAVTAGDAVQLADGTVGVSPMDIAASDKGALEKNGVFKVDAASATTWSDGDEIWYDASAGQAVKKSNALDGDADFRLGVAVGAKASGVTYGYVRLNDARPPFDPIVYEFDCDGDNGDTDTHVLVPAEMNPNGLLITGIYGIVTEAFAGSSEDQGVVTVEDTDGTDLTTITVADAGADTIGDVRLGYKIDGATAGDAAKTVAAGKGVRGLVSTQTSGGTPAGKIKVYVTAIPLV